MSRTTLFFLLISCAAAQAAGPYRILFGANRQGEIDPCGCQVNQIGGLDRFYNLVQKEQKKAGPTFIVDSGDTFFATKTLNASRVEEEKLKAGVIAESYAKIGVDAMVPGERDFADQLPGFTLLAAQSKARIVAANIVDEKGKLVFSDHTVVEKKGVKIAFIGLYSPESKLPVPGWKISDPVEAANATLKKLESEKLDGIFVLSQLGLAEDKKLAEKISVPVIFGSRSMDFLQNPVTVGKTLIVQPQIQGQNIGELEFTGDGFEKTTHRLVDLGKEWQDPKNSVATLIANYKKKVRDLAVAASEVAQKSMGDKPFVAHPQNCRMCHQKQHDFWEQTKHSSAYLVLYAKNQHFDAECIGCHVIGFQSPNGFEKRALPIILENEPKRKKGELPFVEKLMKTVFTGDKGGPVDSREEPERYAKLKKKYHTEIHKLEEAGKIQKIFIGVQCEHCHGNRNGHPDPAVKTIKKVNEASCKECHTPPHAKPYDPTTFQKVACPLASAH